MLNEVVQQIDSSKLPERRLMKVISIVPRLSPTIDGVGDYALNIARELRQNAGIDTQFLICDPDWNGTTAIEGFSTAKIETRSVGSLLPLLKQQASTSVLLQFSGYGYSKRSCCFWLIEALEQWKQSTANAQLVTMFHEVYSVFGVPWKSQFWASPIQRSLAARLIKISDRSLTNTDIHATMLNGLSADKHHDFPTLPVFSNVGEPERILPLSERKKHLVVFGQVENRIKAYEELERRLEPICKQLKIEAVIDIGKPTGLKYRSIGIPLIERGECSSFDISEALQSSIAGFLNYDPHRLAKSGIFAAYCAHGLLPINAHRVASKQDGIISGKHYWTINEGDAPPSDKALQTIANNAYLWYKTHNLTAQSQIFAKIFDRLHQPNEVSII
jgi:hypothetical protein